MSNVEKHYAIPTKHTQAPFRTIWEVALDTAAPMYYIQINEDETKPQWVAFGHILAQNFEDKIHDADFVDVCISIYKSKSR